MDQMILSNIGEDIREEEFIELTEDQLEYIVLAGGGAKYCY